MRLLLDTHVFLWYITADSRLPLLFASAIRDPSNDVYLSAVSVWEAVIKQGLGKLPLPAPPAVYLPKQRDTQGISSLPIEEGAMMHLAKLSTIHRDPFDRLLVAQALQHGLAIATVDADLTLYPVPTFATA